MKNEMKSLKRKLKAGLSAVLAAVMLLSCSAAAADRRPYAPVIDYDGYYDAPASEKTEKLMINSFSGLGKLRENTCYFVYRDVSVSKKITLPESSMLVIRNNASVNIENGGKLYVNGAVLVHTEGALNVNGGSLYLKSKSITSMNGKFNVVENGKAVIYGYAEVSAAGAVNIDGKLSLLNKGKLCIKNEPVVSETAKVKGNPELMLPERRMMYYFDEVYIGSDGEVQLFNMANGHGCDLSLNDNSGTIYALVKNFESVLYKYTQDIELDNVYDANEYLMDYQCMERFEVYKMNAPKFSHAVYWTGITRWNGRVIDNAFYCIVKGDPDVTYFYKILEKYTDFYDED